MNQVMNMLMGQLQAKNPQALKQFEELRKNNGNPQDLLKQVTSNYSPEQMKQFANFANRFGISKDQLQQFGINSK